MSLDPQLAPLVKDLDAGFPAVHTMTGAQARDVIRSRSARAVQPEPVAEVRDQTIPGPGGDIPVRIYRPEAGTEALPTVAFFHGGGWVIGDLDTHDLTCRTLARDADAVVVSVDYRLAPEHPFPAAVDDAEAAARWVAEHAADPASGLGGTAAVAVAGDSAGGNLAAVLAQLAKNEGLQLVAQLLIYPAVDIDAAVEYESRVANGQGYFLTSDDMHWFVTNYLPEGAGPDVLADPRLSPLRSPDLSGLAPAVVLTAEYDPLRDEGEAYAAALEAAGVEVHLHRFDGLIHKRISSLP